MRRAAPRPPEEEPSRRPMPIDVRPCPTGEAAEAIPGAAAAGATATRHAPEEGEEGEEGEEEEGAEAAAPPSDEGRPMGATSTGTATAGAAAWGA